MAVVSGVTGPIRHRTMLPMSRRGRGGDVVSWSYGPLLVLVVIHGSSVAERQRCTPPEHADELGGVHGASVIVIVAFMPAA